MGIKVSNNNLELKIPEFANHANDFAKFESENSLAYFNNKDIISSLNHTNIISGLTLKGYLDNIIISNGYFYDDESNEIVKIDKQRTLKFVEEPVDYDDINYYNVDYTLYMKPNANIIGNIIVDDKYVKNFNNSSYLVMNDMFNPEQYNWEIMFKFRTGGTLSGQYISSTSTSASGVEYGVDSSKFKVWIGSNGTAHDIMGGLVGTHTVKTNTDYWTRISFDGTYYKFEYSNDGINYYTDIQVEKPGVYIYPDYMMIGNDYGKTAPSTSTIFDLKESYIKINDKIWWRGLKPYYDYDVYYMFNTKEFIYSRYKPTEKHKYIGRFNFVNGKIESVFPTTDLSSAYENKFVVKEQLGTTGYRIYANGWKEQWGNGTNPVFPVAFEQIPMYVTRGATNVTKTGMTLAAGYWQAEGY